MCDSACSCFTCAFQYPHSLESHFSIGETCSTSECTRRCYGATTSSSYLCCGGIGHFKFYVRMHVGLSILQYKSIGQYPSNTTQSIPPNTEDSLCGRNVSSSEDVVILQYSNPINIQQSFYIDTRE